MKKFLRKIRRIIATYELVLFATVVALVFTVYSEKTEAIVTFLSTMALVISTTLLIKKVTKKR